MTDVRIVLVGDGTSDRALIPVIAWTLRQERSELSLAQPNFIARGGTPLAEAMRRAIDTYRPDILFVHRDAEGAERESRRAEIPSVEQALIPVIPVRMTEAWLLFDEQAIRTAAGNPNGRVSLGLPAHRQLEALPNPKSRLHEALLTASELSGPRRTRRFRREIPAAVQLVAESIDDFAPLRELAAFAAFEEECRTVMNAWERHRGSSA